MRAARWGGCAAGLLAAAARGRACTLVTVPAPGGAQVISRTMEIGEGTRPGANANHVVVHPRGEHMMNRSLCRLALDLGVDNSSRWQEWDNQLAYVSVDAVCGGAAPIPGGGTINVTCDDYAVEGINEAGLTMSIQTLQQTRWPLSSGARPGMCYNDVGDWALGNFATVDALVAALRNVTVYDPLPLIGQPAAQFTHMAVADATGASVVVEYLDGLLHVHNNTVGMMTNDPDFAWHLRNLNNYVSVGPGWPAGVAPTPTEVGDVPSPLSRGANLLGLPGSFTPPDRFVRSFYLRELALRNVPVASVDEAVVLARALQDANWIPHGAVAQASAAEGFEVTKWSALKIPQERKFLFRGNTNAQWRLLDLTRLDMSRKYFFVIDDGTYGIQDLTHSA